MDGDATIELQHLLEIPSPSHNQTQRLSELPITRHNIYKDLRLPSQSKSIRILVINGCADLDEPLVGSMRVISLDLASRTPFNALSYVWGTYSSPKDTIQCESDHVPITKNCSDALRQLRALRNRDTLTVWIDAVCIDQGNEQEKADQIPLMGEIYSLAEMVYVWLGSSSRASKRAMSCLALAARRNYLPLDPEDIDKEWRWSERARFTLKLLPPYINLKSYYNGWLEFRLRWAYRPDDFDELLGRDWFMRAWTFQEIILAPNITIVCGSDFMSWFEFMRGFGSLYDSSRVRDPAVITEITHYGKWSKIVMLEKEQLRPSTRHLPDTFRAFERVIRLWSVIERPWARLEPWAIESVPRMESFYQFQEHYISLHDRFVPRSLLGKVCFYLVGCGLLLVILVPPLAGLIYLDNKSPSQKVNAALVTWIFIVCLSLIGYHALARVAWWWLPRKGPLGEAEEFSSTQVTNTLVEGIVQILRQRSATDPKDKVYALYGVLEKSGLRDLPRPDYQKPQGQIYHEIFYITMRWQRSIMTLLLDSGKSLKNNSDMSDAPSWVPDWSNLPAEPTISANFFLSGRDRKFNATLGTDRYLRFTHNPNEIIVRGHWSGSITFVTNVFHEIDSSLTSDNLARSMAAVDGPIATLGRWINAIFSTSRPSYPSFSTFRSTRLLGGKPTIYKSALKHGNDANLFDIYFALTQQTATYGTSDRFLSIDGVLDVFRWARRTYGADSCSSPNAPFSIAHGLGRDPDTLATFISLIADLARNERRLFLGSGNVVGCGSKGAVLGDRLALVAGLPAPLVLRATEPTASDWFATEYEVVCSVFVPPWMDGSACRAEEMREIKLI